MPCATSASKGQVARCRGTPGRSHQAARALLQVRGQPQCAQEHSCLKTRNPNSTPLRAHGSWGRSYCSAPLQVQCLQTHTQCLVPLFPSGTVIKQFPAIKTWDCSWLGWGVSRVAALCTKHSQCWSNEATNAGQMKHREWWPNKPVFLPAHCLTSEGFRGHPTQQHPAGLSALWQVHIFCPLAEPHQQPRTSRGKRPQMLPVVQREK